ncbi:hypothetical protein [Brachybacterium sp. P6-10-X1]|uniref:hypothetical protein n=1 Tax=Brachybacterium sp. P6-10-X1 TaxID=1903186 RepID=UPI0012FCE7E5|nr:hypothetical protein [Brachybacterium sp. P6-10-X1]
MPPPPPSTELLIVPTAHLSAATPEPVVAQARERLAAWRPDLVAIEALPGNLVVEYERRGGTFADFQVGGAVDARRGASLLDAAPGEVWAARREACAPDTSLPDRALAWLRAQNIDPLPDEFEAELQDDEHEISGLFAQAVPPPQLAEDFWARWRFHASNDVRSATEHSGSAERLVDGESSRS